MTPKTPNVTFNIFYTILMFPFTGPRFINDAHSQGRAVYAWTVNDQENMRWCIEHGVDGVITDDVRLFVEVREIWQRGERRRVSLGFRRWVWVLWVWVMAMTVGSILRWRVERKGPRRRRRRRRSTSSARS